jgi:hypothetical protein
VQSTVVTSASFTFSNGNIISWLFSGYACQLLGPNQGCVDAAQSVTISSSGDELENSQPRGLSFFPSNETGGQWSEVAAVPELSTWAMLLIGFAGIAAAAYQRKPTVLII